MRQTGKIQPFKIRRLTRRICQGILDRQPHVGGTDLCHDCAILKTNHRVNDALRVDDDLDRIVRHIVEPMRLDDLKPLVDERRGVDRDLLSHLPGRMRKALLERRFFQDILRLATEWAA